MKNQISHNPAPYSRAIGGNHSALSSHVRDAHSRDAHVRDNVLAVQLSENNLEMVPGETAAELVVSVTNNSDRLASFQLEVLAAGRDDSDVNHWYDLSPSVSSLTPPGDQTTFRIVITDTPIPDFFGWVSLTVRVFSLVLKQEERQVLRLYVLPPAEAIPLKVELPATVVRAMPGRTVQLPIRLYNLALFNVQARVKCDGLPDSWASIALAKTIELASQQWTTTEFSLTLPALSKEVARAVPFTIQAQLPDRRPVSVQGTVDVVPVGRLTFQPPEPAVQALPRSWFWGKWFWGRWPWGKENEEKPEQRRSAIYQLTFENASNLNPIVSIDVSSHDAEALTWEVSSTEDDWLPGTNCVKQLHVQARRPWFGRKQRVMMDVRAILSDRRLGTTIPDSRPLQLEVTPIIPRWLAGLCGLSTLWLLWLLSWLNPSNPLFGHQAAVNSVRFDGLGQTILSGSNDQSAILWRSTGFFKPLENQTINQISQPDKAVRVARYRPVDNNLMAIGLENGEIQLWDLLEDEKDESALMVLTAPGQKDDRVLDLLFSDRSQTLFSSHGSGTVTRWQVPVDASASDEGRLQATEVFPFAAYALATVGANQEVLAVAGRYNKLELWNWATGHRHTVDYDSGGQNDYITSLATTENHPYWLAVADNQGRVTLWDTQRCLQEGGHCQTLDSWSAGQDGKAVREVALSRDSCYLASVGDDGRVVLWPLRQGRRHRKFADGKTVAQMPDQLNSVDIVAREKRLWLVSGSDDTRVRLHRTRRPKANCR